MSLTKTVFKKTITISPKHFLFLLLFVSGIVNAQNKIYKVSETITDDRDGQTYTTVQIGDQYWMSENLNYGTFANVSGDNGQVGQKHCYDNNAENCKKLGALYTWHEANSGNICPTGWSIPTKADWVKLSDYLGVKEAAQKIKATPTDDIPWDGNNETGFNAIPSGAGNGEGFFRLKDWALYWTSDENGVQRAWTIRIDGFWYAQPPRYKYFVIDSYYLKTNTLSVRCIKDKE